VAGFDPVILPGGEGKVTVTVSTARYRGPVSKAITVYSNDPKNSRASLVIKGTILVPIEVRPSENIDVAGAAGAVEPREVLIVSRDGEPFDILSVGKRLDHLRVALAPAPEAAEARADGRRAPARRPAEGAVAGGHAAYRLTLTVAGDAPIGRLADVIVLATSHPKEPQLQIRVSGRISGDVVVRPQALYFQVLGPGEPVRKQEVHLVRRPAGGLEILGVESTSPDFVPSVHVVAEGLEYRIDVERPEEKARVRGEATLRVHTSVGVIEVPMSAR
jgi:hypothetical protein